MNETTVEQIETKHKKPLLLEKINECINNKYYKDHAEEFYNDLDELEELGLSEEMSTSIWNGYSELTREPTLMERILGIFTYEIILPTIAAVLAAALVARLIKK